MVRQTKSLRDRLRVFRWTLLLSLQVPLSLSSLALAKTTIIEASRTSSGTGASLIEKWMTVGSGCKATSEQPGDVRFLGVEEHPESANRAMGSARVAFELGSFRLQPLVSQGARPGRPLTEQKQKEQETRLKNYARECAIRFVLVPPPGFRLSSVSARAVAELTKEQQSELMVQGTLKLGSTTVDQSLLTFGSEQAFRYRREVMELFPERNLQDLEAPPGCGEKKIVGLDLTFLTHKERKEVLTEARWVDNGVVAFQIDWERCSGG